ncbi:hypothetical protein BC831DRAFT_258926 [Entophlyctis helioformis]|nr:hypothetical protein BC831DRAFT_258926 [Entophlyctis helioformis]
MRGQQPRWSRLSIACDYCHSKKIRCLGPIGSCPNCVSRKLVCRFDRSLRPKKTAEYVAVLQAEINRLELAIRARSQRPPAGSGGLARHGTAASASASASAWDPASHGRSCTLSSRARDRDTHAHAHAPTRGVMRPSSPRSSQMHLAAIRSAFGMADQTDADVHPTTAASASSSASAAGPASAPGHPDAYPLVPPPSIRLDLLERWFTYVMPKQSGVVLPSWFFMNLDSHPPLLLNAMYAHGMLFPLQPSSLPSSLVSSREPATATATATATISRRFDGDMFYEAAKSYLIGALQTVSLPNILGLLLMGNYARDTGRVEGLVIVAAAARLMQLYMHQKSLVSQSGPAGVQEVDEQTEELTRRLWWSLYESSVQVAIVNNIPGDAFSDIYRPSLPHGSLWDARHGSNDMGGDVRQSRHRHRHRHRHDHGTIFWHSDRHRDQSDNQQQQQEQQEQGHGRYLQLRKLARIQPLMTPYSARMVLLEIFDRVLQFRWIEKECWLQIRQQLKLQQSRGNQKPSLTLADQARLDELESQRWALDRELLKWLNQLPPEWRVVAPAYRCLITVDEVRSVIQRYTAGAASRPSAGGARDTLTTATDDASDTGPSKRLSVDESGAGDAGRRAKRPRHDDAAATAASTAPLDHASPSSENSESSDSSDSSDSSSSDKPPLAWPFAFLLACYHYSRLVLHGSQMRQDQSYTPQLPVEQGIETSQSICLESSGCIMQIVKVFLEQNPDFAEVTPIMSKLIFEAGTAVVSGIKKGVLERDAGVGQVRMAMDALARIGREFAVVAHGMDELSRMLDHVLAGPEDASDSDGSRRSSLQ